MDELNLPPVSLSIKKEQGKSYVFDSIRKKYVLLTPEEWVRQHFIQYLIRQLHYPRSLFRVERTLFYNTAVKKRSDILIYNRLGKPWMLIECKSSTVMLKQEAFNQVSIYNMTIGAKYLAVTNGKAHYCWQNSCQGKRNNLLSNFPAFEA